MRGTEYCKVPQKISFGFIQNNATGRLEAVQPQVVTRPVPSRRLIESDGSIGRGVEFLLNGGWRLARPCNQHNLHNTPCLPEISAFYLHFEMGFGSMSGVIRSFFCWHPSQSHCNQGQCHRMCVSIRGLFNYLCFWVLRSMTDSYLGYDI